MTEQEYKKAARGTIRKDQYEFWDKIVPIRMSDLYHGAELKATLEVLKEWNTSNSIDKCKEIFKKQGHSGLSYGLVKSMIQVFAKGTESEVTQLIEKL